MYFGRAPFPFGPIRRTSSCAVPCAVAGCDLAAGEWRGDHDRRNQPIELFIGRGVCGGGCGCLQALACAVAPDRFDWVAWADDFSSGGGGAIFGRAARGVNLAVWRADG